MQINYMAESRHQLPTNLAPLKPHRSPGAAVWGLLEALLVTVVSPLAPLAPKRFARWFCEDSVLVPLWQIVLLLGYNAYQFELALAWHGHQMPLVAFVLSLLPELLGLGLVWLIGAHMIRPISSTWQETTSRSFWKAGLLLAAFGIPLPAAIGLINTFLEEYVLGSPGRGFSFSGMDRYSILMAINLILISAAVIQIVRGLVAAGGKAPPDLPPICRECGYSLEGVAELYQQHRDATDPVPTVCSECGLPLAESLEPAARAGTAWTRGERLSPLSWWRTLGQVLRQPGRFFRALPLDASRKAALWFWAGNLVLVFVLVVAAFAADNAICNSTHVAGPILPQPQARFNTASVDMEMVGSRQAIVRWLLDCLRMVVGTMLMIVCPTALLLSFSASHVCRQMSKHRSMNLYPAGLLLMSYLSPVVLGVGVLTLTMGAAARLAGEAFLPGFPALTRSGVSAEWLAAMTGLATLVLGLVWLVLVSRRATRGLQYANR